MSDIIHDKEENFGIKTVNFKMPFDDGDGYFLINCILMDNSCSLWIGEGGTNCKNFNNYVMAIPTKFDQIPLATTILPEAPELSTRIAQRISKKIKIQVFVCLDNISDVENISKLKYFQLLENKLIEYLTPIYCK